MEKNTIDYIKFPRYWSQEFITVRTFVLPLQAAVILGMIHMVNMHPTE